MTRRRIFLIGLACIFGFVCVAESRPDDLVKVISKPVSRLSELPGEVQPYLSVSLHAKVAGFVDRILVDRGSVVKEGQLLVELSAPEMAARIAEAESRLQAADSDRLQAEAQLAGIESTYERLKEAAKTPGAIAGNEIVQVEKQVEAAQAVVRSRRQAGRAAQSALDAEKEMQSYLKIAAPFDGVVTDRIVHPGALVGSGADPALLILQQVSRLRLVVAVPEELVGGVVGGARVEFQVPAYPERTYTGVVARLSHALDKSTRTMAVELDVLNRDGSLAPGMYPSVQWPVRRSRPALLVPATSVVKTTERTFVIRNHDGRAEWIDVRTGSAEGNLVEVLGDLKNGDLIVRHATDELREGSPLQPPR